jgi:hypothetical protein
MQVDEKSLGIIGKVLRDHRQCGGGISPTEDVMLSAAALPMI